MAEGEYIIKRRRSAFRRDPWDHDLVPTPPPGYEYDTTPWGDPVAFMDPRFDWRTDPYLGLSIRRPIYRVSPPPLPPIDQPPSPPTPDQPPPSPSPPPPPGDGKPPGPPPREPWLPEVDLRAQPAVEGRPLFGPTIADPVLGGLAGGRINAAIVSLLDRILPKPGGKTYSQRVMDSIIDQEKKQQERESLMSLGKKAGFGEHLMQQLVEKQGWGGLTGGLEKLAEIRSAAAEREARIAADMATLAAQMAGQFGPEKDADKGKTGPGYGFGPDNP